MTTYSYKGALQKLLDRRREALNWTTGVINIAVATSLTNDELVVINLTETIGQAKRPAMAHNRSDENTYWLPSAYNNNNEKFRASEVYPMFIKACRDAGFKVHARWRKDRDAVVFSCTRDSYYDEEKETRYSQNRERKGKVKNPHLPPIPKQSKTQRPVKGGEGSDGDDDENKVCTFKFNVYWDSVRSRWYLPHQQSGCIEHCGHFQLDPSLLRMRLNHALTPDQRQKMLSIAKCRLPPQQI
jgi:hypothetical protein